MVRGVVTLAVLCALLLGTFWGNDDSFPFGPFRMYSVANRASGKVTATQLEGVLEGGVREQIDFTDFGLRRAEVEGQIDRFESDPGQLRLLVDAYESRNPEAPQLLELYLVQEVHQLRGGSPESVSQETLASWSRT
jgi:hypothetical protein